MGPTELFVRHLSVAFGSRCQTQKNAINKKGLKVKTRAENQSKSRNTSDSLDSSDPWDMVKNFCIHVESQK